jgi:hypothetical protein
MAPAMAKIEMHHASALAALAYRLELPVVRARGVAG